MRRPDPGYGVVNTKDRTPGGRLGTGQAGGSGRAGGGERQPRSQVLCADAPTEPVSRAGPPPRRRAAPRASEQPGWMPVMDGCLACGERSEPGRPPVLAPRPGVAMAGYADAAGAPGAARRAWRVSSPKPGFADGEVNGR